MFFKLNVFKIIVFTYDRNCCFRSDSYRCDAATVSGSEDICQSGFRKGRNTMDPVINLEDEIRKAQVNKETAGAVFFDVEGGTFN